MRKYEPIWRQLKETGYCRVITSTFLVARLRKAVIKEKYNDEEFKHKYTSNLEIEVTQTDNRLESIIVFKLETMPNFLDKE